MHPFSHDNGSVACATLMEIYYMLGYRFAQTLKVSIKFLHASFEKRFLHGNKCIFPFDDKTRISHYIVGIIDMEFERTKIVDVDIALFNIRVLAVILFIIGRINNYLFVFDDTNLQTILLIVKKLPKSYIVTSK